MDKNQEKLKPEYSSETISKEFIDLFGQVCDLTRIKAIKNPAKNTKSPISSVEFCKAFFVFLKPKSSDEQISKSFRALIQNVLHRKYNYFIKWQSNGIPEIGNYAQTCFCISAQVHQVQVEKHLADFLNKWLKEHEPNIAPDGLKDFKKEILKLQNKYFSVSSQQNAFVGQLLPFLDSQLSEPIENFDKIKKFIDTHASGYITIEGKIGEAKSRQIAYTAKKFYDTGQYQCVWHFNKLASGHNRSSDLLRSLFSQLKDIYSFLDENPFNIEFDRTLNTDSGYAALYQALFDQLATEEKLKKTKLVIFVDALNEVSQHDKSQEELTNTLFLPPSLINNVFIIVTSKNFDRETYKGNKLEISLAKTEPSSEKNGFASENENDEDWLDPGNFKHIPLCGRIEEIKQLNQFADQEDKFKIWAIEGPSGAGKTRLALEWASELKGWKHYVLHKENRAAKKWENWHPKKPTVIIIDFMFGFEEVISNIMNLFLNDEDYDGPNVRLLLIDHVFADPLHKDQRWGFTGDAPSFNRNKNHFFKSKALDLGEALKETEGQAEIIKSIIEHRADKKEIESDLIEKARTYLVEQGAYYPLFAALVGNAIRLGEDFTKWNRRQLIDYYLSGSDRLPWEHKEEAETGRWASYFIAIATARGKISYDDLRKAAGGRHHIKDVKKICQKVISDKNENFLEAFKPDILGESFFLKLLQHINGFFEYPIEFRQIFMAGDEKTQTKDAIEFIGFIQRLTRNLLSEDQKSDEIKAHWKALFEFMNPSDFKNSEPLNLAVAAGLIEIIEAIKDRFSEEETSALLKKIKPDIFYHIRNDDLLEKSVIYCMEHFELSNRFSRITPKLPNQMVALFKRYTTPYSDEIDIQYLPLFVAIHCRFTKVINALINNKININATFSYGKNALMVAIEEKYPEAIKSLLNANADPHHIDSERKSALIHACIADDNETVELLIEKKVNIDTTDSRGRTALMHASSAGNYKIIELLLQKKPKINFTDSLGRTALIRASIYGHVKVAKLLIDHGAKIDATDILNRTALIYASENCDIDIMKLLLEKDQNIDLISTEKRTSLIYASLRNCPEAVKMLIEKGAKINVIDILGHTALTYANTNGNIDILKLLLENGAYPDIPDKDGRTALMVHSYSGHVNMVKLFLNNGASLSAVDKVNRTPLMYACAGGDVMTTKLLLLNIQAEINAMDNETRTALLWACHYNHTKVVELLLKQDAKTDVVDNNEYTALSIAKANKNKEIIQLLIDHGAKN